MLFEIVLGSLQETISLSDHSTKNLNFDKEISEKFDGSYWDASRTERNLELKAESIKQDSMAP